MAWIIIVMIAITNDAFIYMMEKGASTDDISFKKVFLHSMIYSVVSMIMLNLGLKGGVLLFESSIIQLNFHRLITTAILFGIALLIMISTFKRKDFAERYDASFNYKNSIKEAIICGIDVLLVGISLSLQGYSFTMLSIILFIITFVMIILALYIGYYKGANYQKLFGVISALVYFVFANYHLYQIFINI